MNWIRNHSSSVAICTATLLLPVVFYFQACLNLIGLRSNYEAEIDRIEPRLARLQGLVENEDLLRDSNEVLREKLNKLAYPAGLDRPSISATLQKEMKQLFSDAGLSVSNSQVMPVIKDGSLDHIPVRFTLTGSLRELDDALRSIGEYSPLVLVESLEVWPKSSRNSQPESQVITANLELMSLGVAQL